VVFIAALALVVVPGSAGSRNPSPDLPLDSTRFKQLDLSRFASGSTTTTPTLDPAHQSVDSLRGDSVLLEPDGRSAPARPTIKMPKNNADVLVWHYDPEASFFGPGFYGKRTACGLAYTRELLGVAHRSLPCGTKVTFRNPDNGRSITVPVIDRGPYVAGRTWDLSGAACTALGHCYTGPIYWRY
jgi:rare lipoprotein A (peptidoglycan hydrolase)